MTRFILENWLHTQRDCLLAEEIVPEAQMSDQRFPFNGKTVPQERAAFPWRSPPTRTPFREPSMFGCITGGMVGAVIAAIAGIAAVVIMGMLAWDAVRGPPGVIIAAVVGALVGGLIRFFGGWPARSLGGGAGGAFGGFFTIAAAEQSPPGSVEWAVNGGLLGAALGVPIAAITACRSGFGHRVGSIQTVTRRCTSNRPNELSYMTLGRFRFSLGFKSRLPPRDVNRRATRRRAGTTTMFIPIVIVIAIALAATVLFGILRWQQPLGKITTVIGGLLLITLVAFTLFVLFLADSAQRGAPL